METTTPHKLCPKCGNPGRYTGTFRQGTALFTCPNSHTWPYERVA